MSPSVLTRHFQISQRTLRSDIHNLNEELSGFDAQIIMKRSQGYALEIKEGQTRALLENMLVNEEEKQLDSADKRINHIIIKMLYANTYLTQDALADEVFVSSNVRSASCSGMAYSSIGLATSSLDMDNAICRIRFFRL